MKAYMMRKDLAVAVAVTGILAAVALSSRAGNDNPVALAKALPEVSVSLDQGLEASEREGKPIYASMRSRTAPSSYRSIR